MDVSYDFIIVSRQMQNVVIILSSADQHATSSQSVVSRSAHQLVNSPLCGSLRQGRYHVHSCILSGSDSQAVGRSAYSLLATGYSVILDSSAACMLSSPPPCAMVTPSNSLFNSLALRMPNCSDRNLADSFYTQQPVEVVVRAAVAAAATASEASVHRVVYDRREGKSGLDTLQRDAPDALTRINTTNATTSKAVTQHPRIMEQLQPQCQQPTK
ncbi:hypothetical protein EGR_11001 [Echinococcus granulosus]|uniref:Uncharacterized protein n=1 Tax=Echinococcus granulosus TaxID=6210 RepID=W6U0Z7_ECHGR|nr:hypothetical protein EGR_11001 [Echinococcus granulosus]EUB54136.1 hypothetical protein EGR_11001 [Echinococcus granulosus]